jgi:hypothetical protein
MKLWRVTGTTVVVVAAEDYVDAYDFAREAIQHDVAEDQFTANVDKSPIVTVSDLPEGWDANCIPHGDGDGNTRIGVILEASEDD